MSVIETVDVEALVANPARNARCQLHPRREASVTFGLAHQLTRNGQTENNTGTD